MRSIRDYQVVTTRPRRQLAAACTRADRMGIQLMYTFGIHLGCRRPRTAPLLKPVRSLQKPAHIVRCCATSAHDCFSVNKRWFLCSTDCCFKNGPWRAMRKTSPTCGIRCGKATRHFRGWTWTGTVSRHRTQTPLPATNSLGASFCLCTPLSRCCVN